MAVNATVSLYHGIKSGIKCRSFGVGLGVFAMSFGASFVTGQNVSRLLDESIGRAAENVFDATVGFGANLCSTNAAAYAVRGTNAKNTSQYSTSKTSTNMGHYYGLERGLSRGMAR